MSPVLIAFAVILALGVAGYVLGFKPGDIFGMKLSSQQIAQLASNAGFVGDDLITAVAVALAESSGNPHAHGDLGLPGEGSFGLWQIYSAAHPEYGPDFTALYDPQTNANAAYSIYQTAGFRFTPWTTYKEGTYSAYITQAQQGVNA